MSVKRKASSLIKLLRKEKGWGQKDLAAELRVSRPSISKWERGKADPPINILWKLGILYPPMRHEFREAAGLSQDEITRYVAFLHEDFVVSPAPGDVIHVPSFQDAQQGAPEKSADLLLSPRLVANALSTRYFVVGVSSMGYGLEIGDILVLDISDNDADDLAPFWDQKVLVECDQEMYQGAAARDDYGPNQQTMGRLVLGRGAPRTPSTLTWMAFLQPWSDEPGKMDATWLGEWECQISPWGGASLAWDETKENAMTAMRLYKYWKILGRVVGWFRPQGKKE